MHDRFVLLKRERELTDKDRLLLDGWTANYPELGAAYRAKEDFFDIYAKGTGRIKNARTEAIRVGFDECWKERNYSLIVKVGDRLPETVLQEDPALLMYYDNAASRM